jgi:hypothetical protein
MKIKVSEATENQIDWMVATCLGQATEWEADRKNGYVNSPTTDWSQGGPIIEREKISTKYQHSMVYEDKHRWFATNDTDITDPITGEYGPTPLIAAMRCHVAAYLGDEVTIPEELK